MAKQPAKGRKTPAKRTADNAAKTDAKPEVIEEAVIAQDHVDQTVVPAVEAVEDPVAPPEEPVETASEPAIEKPENPQLMAAIDTESRSSAMPAVLGGVIAGAIGFGIAYMALPKPDTSLAAQILAQSTEISGLRDQVAAIPAPDMGAFEAAQSEVTATMAGLADRITALETRLGDLSSRAGAAGSLSTAAFEQEMDSLRANLDAMSGAAIAELESAREQAVSIQENADAAARNAAARAALARVQGALETGAPFGEALGDLTEAMQADVDEALSSVSDGAPTLASLQASFPEMARAALSTARAEGESGEPEGGLTAFLRTQFGVRSVAPKEGDSADAVLSRAEASLREGRLTDTLAELGALPEVARTELSDWLALAEARSDALAAAATLSTTLNDN